MIEVAGLQKVIDGNLVIDIEALTVRPGEIAAVVGPIGSGREHLLELLLGQSRPTVGTVRLAGIDPVADRGPFSRRVGVLFSDDTLYTRQSSLANLLFHCRLHGLPKSRAAEVLSEVGLADHANVRVEKLPSGLVRRLAFARAILHQPEVLVLAEPLARCDEASIALLSRLIHQLADDGGTQLILADSTAHLTSLCDAIHVLDHGRLVESYAPHEEQRAQLPFKIPVKLEGRVALVNPADIRYVVAERSRAFLETAGGRLPTQFTLAELEKRLARSGFFRAHRGYLVNLQHVKEIIPYTRNSFSLLLDDDDGTEIPLSKSAARELRELLGY
ncbi:MAG TPA: LytTR family transcriptional regulator DNA-binding domain-containing protein [Anaerolineae bacterium]|nr:LytTR family transcriptional regulator DNA-binding domain-containing protein [Anaerolineae bacterium]